jgi:microcystin-dependent protein
MSASSPFLGEIYMFAGNFAPRGWALCNGQLLSIQQNTALFALLGTFYGGNGTTNFALPNLQSRIPVHSGQTYSQGQVDGVESVTLIGSQIPPHSHQLSASTTPSSIDSPGANAVPADTTLAGVRMYTEPQAAAAMNAAAIGVIGGGVPHENRMPFVVVNFIIALQGIFPSRN